jgi:hypothetical protein
MIIKTPTIKRHFKRAGDIFLSTLALILSAPIFSLIALVLKLESPGPVLIRCKQTRTDGKPFFVWEFRTTKMARWKLASWLNRMRVGMLGFVVEIKDGPIVTGLDKFLRRTQLNMMPMFINVLLGDMTLFTPESLLQSRVLFTGDKAIIAKKKTEKWFRSLAFWLPRKYREPIVGDIMEDCHELRALGKSEWRIRIHVIWQLAWALILLRPVALMDALKRMLSTK